MKLALATDDAALAALWPAWERLFAACGGDAFVAPAWLRAWWNAFGNAAPWVACAWNGERLAGVLPLYRCEGKLLPIGVGVSDCCDILACDDATAACLLEVALAAAAEPLCDFPEVPPGARLTRLAAPAGWARADWAASVCPVLSLQPTPAVPPGMRRDVRQACNRAARAGGHRTQRATAATVAADLETLFALHAERWRGRGQAGVLADPTVAGLHRHAAPALLAAGLLRLDLLFLRDEAAAAAYALLGPDSIQFYIGGFAAAAAYESPMTILISHLLQEAAAEGRREANFLRGAERYKYAWGAVDRCNVGIGFRRA